MKQYHKTKDGTEIKLTDLDLGHLKNIIKWIERKANEGVTIANYVTPFYNYDPSEMWYDEMTYYGEDAKRELDYNAYKAELSRREQLKMTR